MKIMRVERSMKAAVHKTNHPQRVVLCALTDSIKIQTQYLDIMFTLYSVHKWTVNALDLGMLFLVKHVQMYTFLFIMMIPIIYTNIDADSFLLQEWISKLTIKSIDFRTISTKINDIWI